MAVGGLGSDGKITFHFGTDRDCLRRRFTFQITGTAASSAKPFVTLTGDLLSSDGKMIPFSQTGVTDPVQDTSGNYAVTFGVDPHDQASAEYSGVLQVTAPGATPLSIPIDVTLRSSYELAWVVLAGGLLIGSLVKWWGGSGNVLRQQLPRLQLIERRLAPIAGDALPQTMREKVADADRQLSDWDGASLKSTLDEIQTHIEGVAGAGTKAMDLLKRVARMRSGALNAAATRLDALTGEIKDAAQGSWDDSAGATTKLSDFEKDVKELEKVDHAAAVQDAVVTILDGPTTQAAAASDVADKGETQPTKSATTWRHVQGVILRGVGYVLFFLSLVALTVYGFTTQYDNKLTFGSAGLSDWVTLFGWGFATALAGKTMADFFGPKAGTTPTQ